MGLYKYVFFFGVTNWRIREMFYIVICEDDVLQRELLVTYLRQIFENLGFEYLLIEFSSG